MTKLHTSHREILHYAVNSIQLNSLPRQRNYQRFPDVAETSDKTPLL